MGRIDEALRRVAAGSTDLDLDSGSPASDVFRSPWTTPVDALPAAANDRAAVVSNGTGTSPITFRQFSREWIDVLAVSRDSNPAVVKQFGRLAGTLHNAQITGGMKVVMTTSVEPGDGKTLTAMNLALALSGSYGRKVLLIDADLRRPSIHRVCGFDAFLGLSDGLQAATKQKLAVLRLTENLSLLPAGKPNPDPMGGLTSDRMREIVADARACHDWVILDTPPVGLVPDASVLAEMVDATLFVVRAGRTPLEPLSKAVEALGRERIFGVVLNGIARSESPNYDSYY